MNTKILLVEDDETNLDMVKRRLERKGFLVLTARNGKEALEVAKEEIPDIILMDIEMPVMDGREATKKLKSDNATQKIPVIALTAHAFPKEKEEILLAGCDDYKMKPIDLDDLLDGIHKLLPQN